MSRSNLTPEPSEPRRSQAKTVLPNDDIELPHGVSIGGVNSGSTNPNGAKGKIWPGIPAMSGVKTAWLGGAVALIASLVMVGAMLFRGGPSESQHPNWSRVTLASQSGSTTPMGLVQVDTVDQLHVVQALTLESADRDLSGTHQVRTALVLNDLAAAHTALSTAQGVPLGTDSAISRELLQQPALANSLRNGSAELYRLELFDSCDEDGDVVEILVNNAAFAQVKLQHQGTPLVIPLTQGKNTIIVRATEDGGGGVTVMFRASNGDYFARDMYPGEDHRMEVIVP